MSCPFVLKMGGKNFSKGRIYIHVRIVNMEIEMRTYGCQVQAPPESVVGMVIGGRGSGRIQRVFSNPLVSHQG